MANMFDTDISIEKMAAYLDGNLSDNEMSIICDVMEKSEDLKMFAQVNNYIDEEVSEYTSHDFELPSELQISDFELPGFDDTTSDFDHPLMERGTELDNSPLCKDDHESEENISISTDENADFDDPASNHCNCSIDTTPCENVDENIDLTNNLEES